MRTTTLYLAAALISAPAALLAQDSTASAGSANGADARISAAIETAVKAGLPASLLERKVAEGEAKHVPMARIAAAVERRLDALTRAQDALLKAGLNSTTEGELSVAADAVQAGVSQSALVSISQRAPEASRAVAIAVLTDLVALGQASDQALVQVAGALDRGPEALANLSAQSAGTTHGEGGIGADVAGSAGGTGAEVGGGAGARIDLGLPRGN